jgi:hypothetical protein
MVDAPSPFLSCSLIGLRPANEGRLICRSTSMTRTSALKSAGRITCRRSAERCSGSMARLAVVRAAAELPVWVDLSAYADGPDVTSGVALATDNLDSWLRTTPQCWRWPARGWRHDPEQISDVTGRRPGPRYAAATQGLAPPASRSPSQPRLSRTPDFCPRRGPVPAGVFSVCNGPPRCANPSFPDHYAMK